MFSDETFPSNSIGQVRSVASDNYYLTIVNSEESYLRHSRDIVKRYLTRKEDKITIKQEIDKDGKSNIYKYDDKGNMFEHTDENGNVEKLVYDDASHLLSMTTYNNLNEEINRRVYYRSPKTGEVLGIRNNNEYSFYTDLGDRTVYITGNDSTFDTYETFFGSVTFLTKSDSKESYKVSKDGDNLVITTDNNTIVYSKDGLILEDNGVKYTYDDNNTLEYTEEDNGDIHIKEYYKDAIKTMREETSNDVMIKRTLYHASTMDVELFERGKKYAVVTYDGDGMKVLKVAYV